jgi:hypothetical protein
MPKYVLITLVLSLFFVGIAIVRSAPADLVYAKDGSGVCGYKDTPILSWCGWHVHDPDRPVPAKVATGRQDAETPGSAPADAIVLFDGADLSKWQKTAWKVENGELIATDGPLATKDAFGDCHLHLEWMAPDPPVGDLFNRGNNGVMLMGLFEIQIFDSFATQLYPDGQAASIYGQTPPLVNACRKPGEWQTYDIIFFAPVFEGAKLVRPARVTMLHNGLLVHHSEEVRGPTGHTASSPNTTAPCPPKRP